MPKKLTNNKVQSSNSTIAKSDDGTIQITFIIPFIDIKKSREKVAEELGKDIIIPGFRKGKAPLDKVVSHVPESAFIEKTLSQILPNLFSKVVNENNLKPIIYPKFELVKNNEDEDWQVRAITCELPVVKLADYKNKVKGALTAKSIWTPNKGQKEDKNEADELSRDEKEDIVLKTLLEETDINLPRILIENEVNNRLSKLLERIEKLGLTLESYLSSIGKKAEDLRAEYESQAKDALSLDLILGQIASKEDIKVDKNQVDEAVSQSIKANSDLKNRIDTPEQRRAIEAILKKRAVLNQLISLN